MTAGYPVTLLMEGRSCLVVGGGRVASRKAVGLLDAGAVVHMVAPRVSPEAEVLAASGLTIELRPYRSPEAASYRLVVAATGDPEVDGAVFRDAEAAGVWVNAADDPVSCSFHLPAVARRGPVSVAVSTGGASPALASWLRDRIETVLGSGADIEVLADLLSEARAALKAAGQSTETANWRGALDSDMLGLIRTGQIDQARERLRACL
ncbi:MAG TPA: bifunctional precorrin-2 dehydrogenase/sirohydrochlorin ferrochelatase [Acidimicrobiales bacterium]|nr:bifunctional precorrin-2 dehydrogenase/sirohydrochlorin ferrochelatase [Acidimicrobiales bacterium]